MRKFCPKGGFLPNIEVDYRYWDGETDGWVECGKDKMVAGFCTQSLVAKVGR
jgi:hypothetical protein